MLPEITSAANPRIKKAARLRESRVRRKERRFLIDGAREINRALASGVEIEELYLNRGALNPQEKGFFDDKSVAALIEQFERTRIAVWPVIPALFEKIAFGARDEGVIALAREPDRTLEAFAERLPENPLLAVLERIEKPGNIGAVFRSADGAKIDGVLLADCGDDFFHPNAIRSSLGTLFAVPSVSLSADAIRQWLLNRQITPTAAICQATRSYTRADYTRPTAIVLGNEAEGLSDLWRDETNGVLIPMLGVADSLNISNAAAILFYEARRQRTDACRTDKKL